jgi:murein DD-endopeptidase MepM/ murein hydrolase activator NlpD
MIRDTFKFQKNANYLALALVFALTSPFSTAMASIVNPETAPSAPASAATQEILDRASHIAFDSASTVQKQQTLSVDKSTAELLKNYMASIVYVPKAALPNDADALDEPWLATTSGTSDGMVVPNMDEDPLDSKMAPKMMDMDSSVTSSVHAFLKFLKPIQNAFVSSPYGFRWGRPHQGIDLAAPVGTPIQAAEGGRVVYSSWKQGYGNFVAVDHGHGMETHYAHCSKILVHVGQHVSKGQLIAKVGNTGNSTGPHLHFEVVANGIHRNPLKFLNHNLAVVQAR